MAANAGNKAKCFINELVKNIVAVIFGKPYKKPLLMGAVNGRLLLKLQLPFQGCFITFSFVVLFY